MEYTAQWGPKGFLVSASKIVPLMGLQTTVAVKSETQNDTSGTAKTNVTGRELQKVSLSTYYMRAAGVDPRAQLEEWEALVGQINTLYIGGKRFGPAQLMLKSVAESEIQTTNDGKFLTAKVDLSFEEYDNGSTTSTASTVKTTTTSTPAAAAKKKALISTPEPQDRRNRAVAAGLEERRLLT